MQQIVLLVCKNNLFCIYFSFNNFNYPNKKMAIPSKLTKFYRGIPAKLLRKKNITCLGFEGSWWIDERFRDRHSWLSSIICGTKSILKWANSTSHRSRFALLTLSIILTFFVDKHGKHHFQFFFQSLANKKRYKTISSRNYPSSSTEIPWKSVVSSGSRV